jgi:hypothetical protein
MRPSALNTVFEVAMKSLFIDGGALLVLCASARVAGQLVDKNKTPNTSNMEFRAR